jgi:hypothetical protein
MKESIRVQNCSRTMVENNIVLSFPEAERDLPASPVRENCTPDFCNGVSG